MLADSGVGEDATATAALATSEMVAYVVANSDPDTDVRARLTRIDMSICVEVVNDDAPTASAFGSLGEGLGSIDAALRPHSVALVDALAPRNSPPAGLSPATAW